MDGRYAGRPAVGIDLHRRRSVVVSLDADGSRSGVRHVVNADAGALEAAVAQAGAGVPVALEACYGWYWAADALAAAGHPVTLVHPSGLGSTWEHRRVKNDVRDAEELARRLQRADLPVSWIAAPPLRELRELVRFRHKLVHVRTGYKSQIHAVLAKQGLSVSGTDVSGRLSRRELGSLPLAPAYATRTAVLLDLIGDLDHQIRDLDRLIGATIAADPGWTQALARARILPGVGPVLGAVFIAEIGDITRFSTAAQLCSWAGMTPRHRESDRKVHRGRITKQGNRLVRWAAVEAIQKHPSPGTPMWAAKRRILARRKDAINVAKVAAARELLECLYYALRDGYVTRLTNLRTGQVAESRSC